MKILLVDDSAFMRSMIKRILETGGHELREASNADEAIASFDEFRPEVVFLDIVMPGRNGIEVLREIKAKEAGARVVMCTSVGGQEKIIAECVDAGATDFITKPFTPEEITNVVDRLRQP